MFGESRTAYISRFPEEFPFYTIKVAAGFPPAAALIVKVAAGFPPAAALIVL